MTSSYVYERVMQGTDRGGPSPDVRERLLKSGSGAISSVDLMAALLGTGVPGKPVRRLAKEVLDEISGGTRAFDISTLMRIDGMGKARSCAVAAAIELGRRLFSTRGTRIAMPKDAFPLLVHYADLKQEHFVVISLNGGHEVNAVREVTRGLINKTVVHPREVFADPITDRACAILVAHNHPSGKLDPSEEDLDITTRLRQSGDILGIPVLDHLIFSETGYYSFVEKGLIAPDKDRGG